MGWISRLPVDTFSPSAQEGVPEVVAPEEEGPSLLGIFWGGTVNFLVKKGA